MNHQPSLFEPDVEAPPQGPPGFAYRPDLISPEEEARLVAAFADLAFKPFEFQGYLGKRRVASFGWRYDHTAHVLGAGDSIPDFLGPLRAAIAGFAGLAADDLQHILVTEYAPGAGIGWHRDRPEFGTVLGVSLLSPCLFRLRRKATKGWERASIPLAPRSAYRMEGPSRTVWEHSIAPMQSLRYSVTFRTLNP